MVKNIKFLIVLLISVLLISCSLNTKNDGVNNNDWYYTLKNQYRISHINSREIVCDKMNDEYSSKIVVGKYVVKFHYDSNYVYLQYLDEYVDDSSSIGIDDFKYATVNFNTDEVLLFESYGDFLTRFSDENLPELSEWINTKPRPENAKF